MQHTLSIKRKLSQSRTNAIIGPIRTIFNHAIKHRLITHLSPFNIEIKKPNNKRERFLEKIENRAFTKWNKKRNLNFNCHHLFSFFDRHIFYKIYSI